MRGLSGYLSEFLLGLSDILLSANSEFHVELSSVCTFSGLISDSHHDFCSCQTFSLQFDPMCIVSLWPLPQWAKDLLTHQPDVFDAASHHSFAHQVHPKWLCLRHINFFSTRQNKTNYLT
jgi:hypothetical protein